MWLFGGGGGNKQEESDAALRVRQVENLRSLPNCHEAKRGTRFDISFVTDKDNTECSLRVTLPDRFPYESPLVAVVPKLQHRYLDSTSHVSNYEAVNRWFSHRSLASTMSTLIAELKEGAVVAPKRRRAPAVPTGGRHGQRRREEGGTATPDTSPGREESKNVPNSMPRVQERVLPEEFRVPSLFPGLEHLPTNDIISIATKLPHAASFLSGTPEHTALLQTMPNAIKKNAMIAVQIKEKRAKLREIELEIKTEVAGLQEDQVKLEGPRAAFQARALVYGPAALATALSKRRMDALNRSNTAAKEGDFDAVLMARAEFHKVSAISEAIMRQYSL